MKTMKKIAQPLKNQKGQGTAEYVLLLVIVVGLVMMFKDKIRGVVESKIGQLSTDIGNVNSQ